MYCVFEHEVNEVGIRLDEFIEHLEIFEISSLLFVENVEVILIGVKLHVLVLSDQIGLCLCDFLVALF